MGTALALANWNLERILPEQPRLFRIQQHLSSLIANIWFFTETHETVTPNSNFFSVISGEPDRQSQPGERWAAIWSQWPLESLERFVTDRARCVAARIVDSPYGELVLYCSVLPWNNDWRGVPAADGQAYEAALNVQTQDWLRLKAEFPGCTLIIAGDFNQDLSARHYYGSKKKRALLEGALEQATLVPLTSGVNDPIARDSSPYACIDHICISAGVEWKLQATSRWPIAPAPLKELSDHFGVSVELIQEKEK